jgi:uncharacterized protein with FMN-binding domain
MKDIRNMKITEINLAKVPDGTYTGKFKKGRWNYELAVTVKSHKIVKIDDVTDSKRNDIKEIKEFNDKLASAVIEKQSVKFDTVAGATINTKAYQEAVSNALTF